MLNFQDNNDMNHTLWAKYIFQANLRPDKKSVGHKAAFSTLWYQMVCAEK